jgi:hypothetical protein
MLRTAGLVLYLNFIKKKSFKPISSRITQKRQTQHTTDAAPRVHQRHTASMFDTPLPSAAHGARRLSQSSALTHDSAAAVNASAWLNVHKTLSKEAFGNQLSLERVIKIPPHNVFS